MLETKDFWATTQKPGRSLLETLQSYILTDILNLYAGRSGLHIWGKNKGDNFPLRHFLDTHKNGICCHRVSAVSWLVTDMPALFVLCCNQLKHSVHSSNLLSHFRKISLLNFNEVLLVNPAKDFTKFFGTFWQYKSG